MIFNYCSILANIGFYPIWKESLEIDKYIILIDCYAKKNYFIDVREKFFSYLLNFYGFYLFSLL
jgi:hypothetical protein